MFKINSTDVSPTAWGNVDKTALRNLLVKGLDDKDPTVEKAIKEVYAVILDADITQAPSTNWWGPHHEVAADGTVTLNKGGVFACAVALAGGRAAPGLTAVQLKSAAKHIASHYKEMKLTAPASLLQAAGEIDETLAINLIANLNGEMSVEDIPVASSVDLEQLKMGDTDPLEVAVEIDSGLSTRKWNYLPTTIQKIVNQINEKTPNGFLGHQKFEDIDSEFPDVATHWIGALFKDGKAFVRGYIDPSMDKLKRLLRSQRIKQVSIFGIPTLAQNKGETQVVDYQLLSLDWTPKDRSGMPTRVVATSEMADLDLFNEFDSINSIPGGGKVNKEEVLIALKDLLSKNEITKEELQALISDPEKEELAKKLNVEPEKVDEEIDRLLTIEQGVKTDKHSQLVDKVLKEKIVDETVRGVVGEILHSDITDDEAKIASEIDAVLQKDSVKKTMSELHTDTAPPTGSAEKSRQLTHFVKTKIS